VMIQLDENCVKQTANPPQVYSQELRANITMHSMYNALSTTGRNVDRPQ